MHCLARRPPSILLRFRTIAATAVSSFVFIEILDGISRGSFFAFDHWAGEAFPVPGLAGDVENVAESDNGAILIFGEDLEV